MKATNQNVSVLLADDNENLGRMFQTVLKEEGIALDYVLNGADAIEKIKTTQYGIIFIDVVMPGMGCIETIKQIRGINKETKIILITGYLLDEDIVEEAGKYSLYAILNKPISISQMVNVIKGVTGTFQTFLTDLTRV